MGHVVNHHRDYRLLQERFDRHVTGAPASPTFTKILELLFTPEEAQLARRFPSLPKPLSEIATKLKMDEDRLSDLVQDLAHRGLMIDIEHKGKRYAALPPVVIGFFEYTFMRTRGDAPMAELARLFDKYMIEDDRFSRSVFQKQTQIGRSLVREESLPQGDHIEILDWERASKVVENATAHAVSLCACRHKAEHLGKACDHEQNNCLSFGSAAEVLVHNGLAKSISVSESMKLLEQSKEAGLAQTGDNVKNKLALTDFIIQVRHEGQMYITGPSVIKQVTGEDVTAEQLGGVESHSHYSGVVHFVAESGGEGLELAKRLLSFLPSNNTDDPPFLEDQHDELVGPDEAMNTLIPESSRAAYDMHEVIKRVIDRADFMEVQTHFAPNLIIGFGRVEGSTVGIVANNPQQKAGVLDIDSSVKGARFIRFCNAFNIPLVTFVDVPGFMPGVQQEYGGIIRHGAKMLFAYGAATVPKITIVVRKAYGGAYLAMCARSMGADRVAAWPTAEIAVMGGEGAVNVLYRKEIEAAEDPEAVRTEKMAEYTAKFSTPYVAAARGMVDDVIEPAETRAYVALSLELLKSKRAIRPEKKHGLIPL